MKHLKCNTFLCCFFCYFFYGNGAIEANVRTYRWYIFGGVGEEKENKEERTKELSVVLHSLHHIKSNWKSHSSTIIPFFILIFLLVSSRLVSFISVFPCLFYMNAMNVWMGTRIAIWIYVMHCASKFDFTSAKLSVNILNPHSHSHSHPHSNNQIRNGEKKRKEKETKKTKIRIQSAVWLWCISKIAFVFLFRGCFFSSFIWFLLFIYPFNSLFDPFESWNRDRELRIDYLKTEQKENSWSNWYNVASEMPIRIEFIAERWIEYISQSPKRESSESNSFRSIFPIRLHLFPFNFWLLCGCWIERYGYVVVAWTKNLWTHNRLVSIRNVSFSKLRSGFSVSISLSSAKNCSESEEEESRKKNAENHNSFRNKNAKGYFRWNVQLIQPHIHRHRHSTQFNSIPFHSNSTQRQEKLSIYIFESKLIAIARLIFFLFHSVSFQTIPFLNAWGCSIHRTCKTYSEFWEHWFISECGPNAIILRRKIFRNKFLFLFLFSNFSCPQITFVKQKARSTCTNTCTYHRLQIT